MSHIQRSEFHANSSLIYDQLMDPVQCDVLRGKDVICTAEVISQVFKFTRIPRGTPTSIAERVLKGFQTFPELLVEVELLEKFSMETSCIP